MNHFGLAFGVIVASVIGGAVVFDRVVSKHEIVLPPAARAATAPQEPSVAETSTSATSGVKLAQVTPAPSVATAPVEPRPQVSAPARSIPPKKTAATITPRVGNPASAMSDTANATPQAPDAPAIAPTPPATPSGDSSSVSSPSSEPQRD